jgi:hypothetical protein
MNGGRADFPKNLRASLFNVDLSNEPWTNELKRHQSLNVEGRQTRLRGGGGVDPLPTKRRKHWYSMFCILQSLDGTASRVGFITDRY